MRYFIFITTLFLSSVLSILADAKSDYEYQYTKYRESYQEFRVFKKDYLSTPSLDNQQKVLLSLKQSLMTRDLAKASLARHLIYLINIDRVTYDPLNPILQNLNGAYQYFSTKANEAQTVVTLENLKEYDQNYLVTSVNPERALKFGVIAHKIAKLIHIQDLSLKAQNELKYKLPDSVSIRVSERIIELENDHQTINKKIDDLATYILSPEGRESVDSPIFFSGKVEKLSEIRNMQLNWIDKLIDLDQNYGKI